MHVFNQNGQTDYYYYFMHLVHGSEALFITCLTGQVLVFCDVQHSSSGQIYKFAESGFYAHAAFSYILAESCMELHESGS